MQACFQASEAKWEASMHLVHRPSPSILMLKGADQWRWRKAQLAQDRVQACKAGVQGTWLSMGRRSSSSPAGFSHSRFSKSKWSSTAAVCSSSNDAWSIRGASSSWQEVVLQLQNIKNGILQCPSSMWSFRIQDTRSRPISGILMSKRVLAVQVPLHLSCVIATLWRAQMVQVILEVVHSQQTTLSFSIVMLPWRIFNNSRGIPRSFNSKRHVFVYGQMEFMIRSWMSRRKSRIGSQVWLMNSIDCAESNQHGFNICNLKGTSSLQCRWPQLPAHSRHKHHPVQRLWSQWSQLQLQGILPWQVLQRMHHSRRLRELIHGQKPGLGSSTSEWNWWCDSRSSSRLWKVQVVQLTDLESSS